MSKFFPLKLKDRRSFQFAFLSAIWLLCFAATDIYGQTVPEAINYQAIVRDAGTFLPISDQGAYVSIEFLDGPDGDVLYQEEFPSIQTGKAGLINLSLGQGNPLISSFNAIPWESGNVWLRLSVDIGNGLNILQENPFSTVPYAFYAKSSGSNGADGDGDSTNELIEEVVLEGANLLIMEGDLIQTVDLSSLYQDEDADPLNEIQDLSLNVSTLTLTGDGTTVDLSALPGLGDDADADPLNEIQDLSLNVSTLTLTGDGTTVDLSALPGLGDDADADPLNEIQDLSLNVSTLTLTGDGTTVDLSALPGLGDDADADAENELQNIQLVGNFLSLTDVSPAALVDLDRFDQSDLSEGLIFIGDGSDEATEVEIYGDINLDAIGEATVKGIQGIDVSDVNPTNDQVLVYNASESEWQPATPSSISPVSTTEYYSIDPLDFRELADPILFGADLSSNNGLKFFDDDAPFAMLRNEGIIEIMAPLHLPHGSTINKLKVYYRNSAFLGMQFSLYRKDMTNFSVGNEVLITVLAGGLLGDVELDLNITNQNVVDNAAYSYRLYVRFTTLEGDDNVALEDVDQRVYGAVIEYTTN
ncbi:MAG: post-segregation antitoxin (ccd killing protein) [Cryomorphaceae bacterium]|jgi:post-segregation antitoxin (ccd killing protein)